MVAVVLAAGCAEPDLGPPSSTTVVEATPTPTPEPESDSALLPSNQPTPTATVVIETPPTPTPTPEPRPEVGLTESTLRVGVIADVTTGSLADPRGESAWNAVASWARAVNDSGGLAGRRVVVQPIDSAVFSHADALREACEDVFAIVGSWAINDGDGLDVMLSPDCSMPDFPAEARTPARRRSPTTYQSNPLTIAEQPAGAAQQLAASFPDEVTATAVPVLDLDASRVSAERQIEAFTESGFTVTHRPTVALDADLAEVAAGIADAEVTALVWTADAGRLATLLAELDELDALPPLVHCSSACYGSEWPPLVGELGNGVTVSLPVVPFEEVHTSFELTQYTFWLGRVRPEERPDVVGVQAWASARLFEEAVRRATMAGTEQFDPELLTRSAVLDAAETITSWDAHGLQGRGTANPADGEGAGCFVLMELADGRWTRSHPFGAGLLDCGADNLVTLELTADLGLAESDSIDLGPTNSGGGN